MFRVGQKVACVDASGCRLLDKGAVYTILEIAPSGLAEMISVDCRPDYAGSTGYSAARFRPIVERKTDISIFTEMLTPTPRRVRETTEG
jgi:hypothetical protein